MSSTNEPQFEILRSIRFPPPPPTHNSLTPSQRAQLLRKTRKLEQILGVAPHLLDEALAPVHITFPSHNRSRKTLRSSEESSSSSSSGWSSSSSSTCSSPTTSCPPSPSHRRSSSTGSLTRSPSSTLRKSPPCRDSRDAPCLRLVDHLIDDERLPPTPRKSVLKPSQQAVNGVSSGGSGGCARKTKMDRLRKRLGEDVPVDLVFPDEHHRRTSSVESVGTVLCDFPTPRLRMRSPKKGPVGTIAGARNSLVEVNGIHKAPRSSTSSSSSSRGSSPSSSPESSPVEGVPPPLPPKSASVSGLRTSSRNESLLAIFESPDESEERRCSWSYRKHDMVSFIDVGA